jgi:hypothetical protein
MEHVASALFVLSRSEPGLGATFVRRAAARLRELSAYAHCSLTNRREVASGKVESQEP